MNVVIIGAGQTGRGFVAPFFHKHGAKLTFIDKDNDVIRSLQKEGVYQIKYFGDAIPPLTISSYEAYLVGENLAVQAIADADVITTSVFAQQIITLVPLLQAAIHRRNQQGIKKEKLIVLCIENGVGVKQPLVDANLDAIISEGIIFCTSMKHENSLMITSEDYPILPIDGAVEGLHFEVAGMPLEPDFQTLIQRKIYTYNFFSAVVCYLGSYGAYDSYASAANDPVIASILNEVAPIINQIIATQYHIALEKQVEFGGLAIKKFQNKYIKDSIVRNAQQAQRKLGPNERLLVPLQLAIEQNQPITYFCFIIAAALHYGFAHEKMDVETQLKQIAQSISSATAMATMTSMWYAFQKGMALTDIVSMTKNL